MLETPRTSNPEQRTKPLAFGFGGAAAAKPPRTWQAKFFDALRGWKLGIRGHSSFFVHFFCAVLVLAAAIVFQCSQIEWCLLLGCIGFVLTAELFNSAIETLVRALEPRTRERCGKALDIAAGAVLLAATTAIVAGSLVFVPKLVRFLGWQ
jgi:diacylglycerol kinase